MDARFDKLDEKLDKISNDLTDIKIVQAEQAKDLKYHIKRTDQNEKMIIILEKALKPIVRTYHRIEGAFKVIGAFTTVAGLIIGAIKIFF